MMAVLSSLTLAFYSDQRAPTASCSCLCITAKAKFVSLHAAVRSAGCNTAHWHAVTATFRPMMSLSSLAVNQNLSSRSLIPVPPTCIWLELFLLFFCTSKGDVLHFSKEPKSLGGSRWRSLWNPRSSDVLMWDHRDWQIKWRKRGRGQRERTESNCSSAFISLHSPLFYFYPEEFIRWWLDPVVFPQVNRFAEAKTSSTEHRH